MKDNNEEKVAKGNEGPREICGLMLTFDGGLGVQTHLTLTTLEFASELQAYFDTDREDLISFNTANASEQEVCMFYPKKIIVVMVKREFILDGNVVPISRLPAGQKLDVYRH